VDDEIPAMITISTCWHDSQTYQIFCDECTPYHKVEDVADVRAAEAAEKLTINTNSSTSDDAVNFTLCRKMLKLNPLLNSTLSDFSV